MEIVETIRLTGTNEKDLHRLETQESAIAVSTKIPYCRVSATNLGSGAISWATEDADNWAMFDAGTPSVVTIQKKGLYRICLTLWFPTGVNSLAEIRQAWGKVTLNVSGTNITMPQGQVSPPFGTSQVVSLSPAWSYPLTVGDTVSAEAGYTGIGGGPSLARMTVTGRG